MTSKYPNGFAHGVAIRNIPITVNPSDRSTIYWVDSVNGHDTVATKGSVSDPFDSIAYAVAKIYNGTSAHGSGSDIIYVAAGHTETVVAAGTLTVTVPGLTIIFMGEGSSRATINYTTATTASVIVSAANVTFIGPRFIAGIDALSSPITVTGADFSLVDGEWYDAPAKAAVNCIVASTAASRININGWKYYASTTGTQKVSNINLTAIANPVLKNINIVGDFSTAPIAIPTACTNVVFDNVYLNSLNATPKPGMTIAATTTGIAKNVDIMIVSGATFVSSVALLNWGMDCYGYHTGGQVGTLIGSAYT